MSGLWGGLQTKATSGGQRLEDLFAVEDVILINQEIGRWRAITADYSEAEYQPSELEASDSPLDIDDDDDEEVVQPSTSAKQKKTVPPSAAKTPKQGQRTVRNIPCQRCVKDDKECEDSVTIQTPGRRRPGRTPTSCINCAVLKQKCVPGTAEVNVDHLTDSCFITALITVENISRAASARNVSITQSKSHQFSGYPKE